MTFPIRASGILLHPTALPGSCGIGTLGSEARYFIDWLKEAGQSYWQICPLIPTGYGDSPYQGFSAFAGNQNLISLDELISLGLLTEFDLAPLKNLPEQKVDFGKLIPLKTAVLHKAWKKYTAGAGPDTMLTAFERFSSEEAYWLNDFSLFMVIKTNQNGLPWNKWDYPLRFRDQEALKTVNEDFSEELEFQRFIQFLFYKQWNSTKKLANQSGIKIIGDLPIFVAYDSADCWSNPELFQLDEKHLPTHVAGVPPDYFSKTGQLWGNPLYDWEHMEKDNFSWWISILKSKLEQYDALRIDHFRGFSAYWSVPFSEPTAVNGNWIPASGGKLFERVREILGDLPIIAEDLGVITDDVVELINECGFPGMKVLQFAFNSNEDSEYLPHNYDKNCIVYTGTHDNNTSRGWFSTENAQNKEKALAYMNLPENTNADKVSSALVRTSLSSVSNLAITPLQDILCLDGNARFNTPGTLGNNWTWRVNKQLLNQQTASNLYNMTALYGRIT